MLQAPGIAGTEARGVNTPTHFLRVSGGCSWSGGGWVSACLKESSHQGDVGGQRSEKLWTQERKEGRQTNRHSSQHRANFRGCNLFPDCRVQAPSSSPTTLLSPYITVCARQTIETSQGPCTCLFLRLLLASLLCK